VKGEQAGGHDFLSPQFFLELQSKKLDVWAGRRQLYLRLPGKSCPIVGAKEAILWNISDKLNGKKVPEVQSHLAGATWS